MTPQATHVVVVPNDISAKAWLSIMLCPWSKLAKDSKDGTFTFSVCFVTPETFKSYAENVTRVKPNGKRRKGDSQNAKSND